MTGLAPPDFQDFLYNFPPMPTCIIGTKLTLWKIVERSVYNILHGRKSE